MIYQRFQIPQTVRHPKAASPECSRNELAGLDVGRAVLMGSEEVLPPTLRGRRVLQDSYKQSS